MFLEENSGFYFLFYLRGPQLSGKSSKGSMTLKRLGTTVLADIKAMFHQIKVDPRDENTLRFLWWTKGDLYKESKIYKMVVHPFGAILS